MGSTHFFQSIALGKVFRCVWLLTALILLCVATATAQSIRTFAGTGEKGSSGENEAATSAKLNDPTGIARGADGALYICDTANHRIRKVTRDGKIVTVAGTGEPGWNGDGGPALAAKLNEPYEVRSDAAGNIFWVERLSHSVRKLDAGTGGRYYNCGKRHGGIFRRRRASDESAVERSTQHWF